MEYKGITRDCYVVVPTILFLGALLTTGLTRTNNIINWNTDMSHLRQIATAQLSYSELWGDSYTTRPLIVSGAIPSEVLVSPSDGTKNGYANLIRGMTKSPSDPETYYRDSFLPISAVMNPSGIARVVSSTNAGWLVVFSGSETVTTKMSQPCFSGTFLRLKMDGSVVVKKHRITYDYPKKNFGPF